MSRPRFLACDEDPVPILATGHSSRPGKRVRLYHRLRGRQTSRARGEAGRDDHTVPASRVIPFLTW